MGRFDATDSDHQPRTLAWWWRLAPALVIAAPLLMAQHGSAGQGGATVVVLTMWALTLCAAGLLALRTTYVAGAQPAPALVRRRASHLPAPLAVATPRVPHGPRAPGQR